MIDIAIFFCFWSLSERLELINFCIIYRKRGGGIWFLYKAPSCKY
jgi:hypothetical protein